MQNIYQEDGLLYRRSFMRPMQNLLPAAKCKFRLQSAHRSLPYRYLIRLRRELALFARHLHFSRRNQILHRPLLYALTAFIISAFVFYIAWRDYEQKVSATIINATIQTPVTLEIIASPSQKALQKTQPPFFLLRGFNGFLKYVNSFFSKS